ncbi:hypothetical protein C7293_25690 [filamentous cyanobacterium CCT1]|nr:hypothetical protein C7293_25690 [filamentous cyanobacterium CCT1]PSN79657.1 hypothetical protein C8B47_10520 [filamentous cyanobacterium CCP4]
MVWGTLAVLGLGAVVVPQYLSHPEWRSQYDAAVDSPAVNSGTDLSALTNEDLADLAEIDNLALLLDNLQPTTSTALEVPAADADRLALPQATSAEDAASPFAQYLERSRFRFSPAPSGAEGEGESGIAIENRPSTLAPGQRQPSRATATEALPPSPLQQALSERLNSRPAQSAAAESATETGTPSSTEAPTSGLTPPPWMVEGNLPGVDQRFIRTTPQMSPPPGTTGYTQPPGLSPASPVAPTRSPLGTTTPAPLNLDFGSPATAPVGNGQVRSQPSSLNPSISTPLPQPAPPPFSAPRPPGVYSGNGYINTFSDPTGPPAN